MKRKYRSGLASVLQGIHAAVTQGASLARSAERLQSEGDHALALSVAVLSLEEIGKALLIDGLLFAKAGDEKAAVFERGHRKHTEKLRYVQALPMYLEKQATADPRSEDAKYHERIAAATKDFNAARAELISALDVPEGFEALDRFKQRGFYTELKDGMIFELPAKSISLSLAAAVVTVARTAANAAEIPFEVGVEPYVEFIEGIRGAMTEAQHQELEVKLARLYRPDPDQEGGSVH